MAAEKAAPQAAYEVRLTVPQALQFDEALYRRFTAVHEAGHAVVALATGDASVSECVIAPTQAAGAGRADAYTDVRWRTAAARHTLLYGGLVAQQRWLHEQQLWSPLRESAVQILGKHDFEALKSTGATAEQLEQAHTAALAFRDRHWPAITAVSELLDHKGTITGAEVQALLRQDPAGARDPEPLTLTDQQRARAAAITAASRQRARRGPSHTPQSDHQPRQPSPAGLPSLFGPGWRPNFFR
ncbi:hypothetical protein [Streptomyces olivaceus]|uniref:hypothetical protein n=1 Tax=Streptomyces olivaceus TaxID=47716 RepID=UPI0036C7D5A7